MPRPFVSIEDYDHPDVIRAIWNVFSDLANSRSAADANHHYQLFGNIEDSVIVMANQKCVERDVVTGNNLHSYPPFKHMVLKVFQAALNQGLVLHSRLNQAYDWNNRMVPFHFTSEGINYFSNENFVGIDDPDYFQEVLLNLQKRISCIQDGQIELLLEAQRCIRSGCYRAAMVVMGVANEDLCIELLDAIPINCRLSDNSESNVVADWGRCCNASASFSARWKPGIRILEEVKRKIRHQIRHTQYAKWLEMIPGALYTVGEAVRISRNVAAHEPKKVFDKPEAALLIAAMPIQLEMIANLTEFFLNTPDELKPITL